MKRSKSGPKARELRRRDLIRALAVAKDQGVLKDFLTDAFSSAELKRAANRWAIARELIPNPNQAKAAAALKVNKATVGRVFKSVGVGEYATGAFGKVYRQMYR